jgi:hypothetical protein
MTGGPGWSVSDGRASARLREQATDVWGIAVERRRTRRLKRGAPTCGPRASERGGRRKSGCWLLGAQAALGRAVSVFGREQMRLGSRWRGRKGADGRGRLVRAERLAWCRGKVEEAGRGAGIVLLGRVSGPRVEGKKGVGLPGFAGPA